MASSHDYLFRSLALPSAAAFLLMGLLATAAAAQQDPAKGEQAVARAFDDANVTSGLGNNRPPDERALFQAFAKIEGLSATYTEEKHLSLLRVPLKSKGTLSYLRPGYLSRIVTAPEKSRLTITKTELRMVDKQGTETIDLRQSDRVRLFVTSLVQVFRGDRDELKKHYRIRYTPKLANHSDWQLELQPLKKPLDQIVKNLVLHGRGMAVTRIELHEPNGDRTVTKMVKVDAKRTFTDAEKLDLFGIAKAPGKPPAKAPAKAAAEPAKTGKTGRSK